MSSWNSLCEWTNRVVKFSFDLSLCVCAKKIVISSSKGHMAIASLCGLTKIKDWSDKIYTHRTVFGWLVSAQYETIHHVTKYDIRLCLTNFSPSARTKSSQTKTHKLLYDSIHLAVCEAKSTKNHVYLRLDVSKQWAWIHLSKLNATFSSQSQNYHILIAIETGTETVAPECAKTNQTMFIECDCHKFSSLHLAMVMLVLGFGWE